MQLRQRESRMRPFEGDCTIAIVGVVDLRCSSGASLAAVRQVHIPHLALNRLKRRKLT
jgi:hypothetical protein